MAGILLMLGLAYLVDRATVSDLTLFPYLFPIGLTLYNFGTRAACLVSTFAALLWFLAQPGQTVFAVTARALLFLLLTLLAASHQRAHRRTRDQLRLLSQLLPLCPNCGQRIGLDGQWRDPACLPPPSRLDEEMAHHCCPAPLPSQGQLSG